MTISSENVKNRYSGNGSTTVFAYSYKVTDEDHLSVVVADADDAQTTLTISTHYTVSGVGADGGGNVTTTDLTSICGAVQLPSGWSITISRNVPLLQETDFENQGGFYADTHEDSFDLLIMVAHQLQEQLDRCPKVSITSGESGDDYLTTINAAVSAASASASAASASETAAAASAAASAASETAAATSETNAAASETAAAASELAASNSETAAATSEANASTSETNAAASETAASTSEGNAATSETNAAASAAAASTSETNAGTSETNAAASETAAATSETNAATSETNAAASAATIPTIGAGDALKLININSGETAYQKTGVEITADDALDLPEQSSTPTTPSSGRMLIYPKNDGRLYHLNDDGEEVEVGSGSGQVNFLSLKGISDFNGYDDGAVAAPVDGTGGSPAAVSVAEETVGPIDTTNTVLNLKISKTAADGQGEGVSVDFTTRGEIDYARPQTIRVEIKSSANYVDDDFGIYIYDKDNSALITPNDPDVKASTLVSSQILEFQTSSDADDYRLIFHCKTTNANAYDLTCTVTVGPSKKLVGTPITDWESYTPSTSGLTIGNGTLEGFWRRKGDSLDVAVYFALGSTSAVTGSVTFGLPSGLSVDSAKNTVLSTNGSVELIDNGTAANRVIGITRASGTDITLLSSDLTALGSTNPFTWAQDDKMSGMLQNIPVAGWGSNVKMADIDSNRVVACQVYLAGNQVVTTQAGSGDRIDLDTTVYDTLSAWDNTNHYFVAPSKGFYFCRGHVRCDTMTTTYFLPTFYVNNTDIYYGGDADIRGETCQTFELEKGDTVELRIWQNESTSETVIGGVNNTNMSIHKIVSNESLMANEFVGCLYESNTASSMTNATYTIVDFEDKVYDSHSAVTVGTWKFTAPVTGKYHVSAQAIFDPINLDAGERVWCGIFKNGSANTYRAIFEAESTAALTVSPNISVGIDLVQGDYIDFRVYQDSGADQAIVGSVSYNRISVHKIG